MIWALVAVIVLSTTVGDVWMTIGMRRVGEVNDFRVPALLRVALRAACNPFIIGGVGMMAVSFFAFLSLISREELSFAVPATAASVVIETVMARLFLKEQVNWKRWAGAGLVACGVFLLNK